MYTNGKTNYKWKGKGMFLFLNPTEPQNEAWLPN